MGTAFLGKFDSQLKNIYLNYLQLNEKGKVGGWIHPAIRNTTLITVNISYDGNLSEIGKHGFNINYKEEGSAFGSIDLANLASLASDDDIKSIRYGDEMELDLLDSVPNIQAREMPEGSGNPHVWSVKPSTGIFAGKMGEGVVIGIIDTGIDYRHPNFLLTETPLKQTRILRIWDQGLSATGSESGPSASHLLSSDTYGVEYEDGDINAILQGVSGADPVRHKDCVGHGTHIAATAAGDGRASGITGSPYEYAGVAPKASMVIVKMMHLQNEPTDSTGAVINFEQRYKDAIKYIFNVVKSELEDRPIVINFSIGNPMGPHDGLTDMDLWLSNTFDGKPGKIFVTSAGNYAGRENHAVITIPSSGKIEVPLKLYDKRTKKKDYYHCTYKSNTRSIVADIYYKDISPGTVKASLKLPGASFVHDLPLGKSKTKNYDGGKEYSFGHDAESAIRPGSPPTNVTRNNIRLRIRPDGDKHRTGTYTIKLEGPAGTEFHLWCSKSKYHGFSIPASPSSGIDIVDEYTLGSPGTGENVISVAAYNDHDGEIAFFSSRGPTVDYSGHGPIASKPDVSAPGWKIQSAESYDINHLISGLRAVFGYGYEEMSGTSMACPHVAGVVALLLEKDNSLTHKDVLKLLEDHAGKLAPPEPNVHGNGRLNAHASFTNVP